MKILLTAVGALVVLVLLGWADAKETGGWISGTFWLSSSESDPGRTRARIRVRSDYRNAMLLRRWRVA